MSIYIKIDNRYFVIDSQYFEDNQIDLDILIQQLLDDAEAREVEAKHCMYEIYD